MGTQHFLSGRFRSRFSSLTFPRRGASLLSSRGLGRRLVIAALLVAAATGAKASFAEPLEAILSQFIWTGTYDLVGTGFPDGERHAVMEIRRADTSYTLASLQGPPGSLVSFKVTSDSARVVWDLGTEQMLMDLRGIGDSLIGEWSTSEWSGEVRGIRRR